MQSSSEQPLVGEEHCVTTRITAAKETKDRPELLRKSPWQLTALFVIEPLKSTHLLLYSI